MYLEKDVDSNLDGLFLDISIMSAGPEFEYSYQKLHDIADRLIAGEDVKL